MYKAATRNKHARQNEYDLQGDLERIRSAIADAALDVKGKAGDMLSQSLENAKERSLDFRENVGEYTKKQPFKTIGLAVLAGMVIGLWFHRK